METTQTENSKECGCPMCQTHAMWHGMCGHHRFGRFIVRLLIIAFIFWLGTEVGEHKAERYFHHGGYPMMMQWYGNDGYDTYGPGMMGNYFYSRPEASSTSARQ